MDAKPGDPLIEFFPDGRAVLRLPPYLIKAEKHRNPWHKMGYSNHLEWRYDVLREPNRALQLSRVHYAIAIIEQSLRQPEKVDLGECRLLCARVQNFLQAQFPNISVKGCFDCICQLEAGNEQVDTSAAISKASWANDAIDNLIEMAGGDQVRRDQQTGRFYLKQTTAELHPELQQLSEELLAKQYRGKPTQQATVLRLLMESELQLPNYELHQAFPGITLTKIRNSLVSPLNKRLVPLGYEIGIDSVNGLRIEKLT